MTSQLLVLLGQILGAAFASGLNLYATVAVIGIASRLGWIAELPPALKGLEDGLVIASAAGLYIVEFAAARVPYVDSIWETIHTLIRPSAAALLAFAALDALPLEARLAGALLAGTVALAAHGAKTGLRLAISSSPRPVSNTVIGIAEDAAAITLPLVALVYPSTALAVGGATVVLVALLGPRLWRAFGLGLRALAARLRRFFGHARWHEPHELPGDLQALLEPTPVGLAPPRATRAALKGIKGVGAYRNGWLVITPNAPAFLYRSLFGPRRVTLPPIRTAHVRPGRWIDTVDLDAGNTRCTLFLLKDGPPTDLALADLVPVPS